MKFSIVFHAKENVLKKVTKEFSPNRDVVLLSCNINSDINS